MRPTERHDFTETRWAHSLHRFVSPPVENLSKIGQKIGEDIVLTQSRPCAKLSLFKTNTRPSGTRKLEREKQMKPTKVFGIEIHRTPSGDQSGHGKVLLVLDHERRRLLKEKMGRDIMGESLWVKNLQGAPGISYHAADADVDVWYHGDLGIEVKWAELTHPAPKADREEIYSNDDH